MFEMIFFVFGCLSLEAFLATGRSFGSVILGEFLGDAIIVFPWKCGRLWNVAFRSPILARLRWVDGRRILIFRHRREERRKVWLVCSFSGAAKGPKECKIPGASAAHRIAMLQGKQVTQG